MNCAGRPTCSPIWWSCSPSSAAIRPSARPRASRVIMRRNSCSARPRRCHGAMTTTSTIKVDVSSQPDRNCPLCPRLVEFREDTRTQHPDWFNAPVPSFGDTGGRLLIVGLAPGLQGANRTGRPFTGDFAGVLLYDTLIRYGFARGQYAAHPDDGLEL